MHLDHACDYFFHPGKKNLKKYYIEHSTCNFFPFKKLILMIISIFYAGGCNALRARAVLHYLGPFTWGAVRGMTAFVSIGKLNQHEVFQQKP